MTPRKTTRTTILIGLITTLACLVILESLSRILFTVRADFASPGSDWYQYVPDVGWERRPHFKGVSAEESRRQHALRYQREFDSRGFFAFDTEQIHSSAQKKILVIGDSNTFGWGVPSRSAYPEVLDDLRRDTAVINLGVPGHSSFQGYEMLIKHFEQIRPDVVIASYSFNDRRIVPADETADSRGRFERLAQSQQFDLIRGKVYLFRMIESGMSKLGLLKSSGEPDPLVDLRRAKSRVSPEQYRQNLEHIARFCQERHVPLVFVVFQDNPAHSEHLRAGIAHLNHGRYEQAERELRVAVNIDNGFSDLARKHLAMALERRGASEEAKVMAALNLPTWAVTQGGKLLHLDAEYNDIVRAVATQYGATVVEAGQVIAQDPSLYLDMCHPDERGHRLTANLLNHALDGLLIKPHVTVRSASSPPES
jgi:lysophospholipase L1-like esterase